MPEGITPFQHNRQKFQEITQSNSSLRSVVELLRQGNEADSALVLSRIRQADNADEAVDTVAVAQALLGQASAGQSAHATEHIRPAKRRLASPDDHPRHIFEKNYERVQDQYIDPDVFVNISAPSLDFTQWTTACDDNILMNHLMNLFWTWDNIVERLLYRPMFEEDFKNGNSHSDVTDRLQFCSPFLVNALLALGCLYSMDPSTFAVHDDPKTRGRRFAEEAERHLEKEKSTPSITLLQGLHAMFCYEGNLGSSGLTSIGYYNEAIETFKALNNPEFIPSQNEGKSDSRLQKELEGMSWVMWGYYITEWRSTQAFHARKKASKPILPKTWQNKDFPLSKPDVPGYWWFPYPMSLRSQPSMKVEMKDADVLLSEIAEDIMELVHPDPCIDIDLLTGNTQRAVELYNALVLWRVNLPPRISSEDAVLPSALLLHCSAEILFTTILRPFCHLTKSQFGSFNPKHRCFSHAISLESVIWTFRACSVLHHEYWLCHAISTAAFITIGEREMSPMQIDTLIKACQCLREMGDTLPIALDCLSAIHGAFRRHGNLPGYLKRFFVMGKLHRKDGLMHHAIAALMPEEEERNGEAGVEELSLQELLLGLDGVGLD